MINIDSWIMIYKSNILPRRQCIEGGKWTGPPPSCKPILCQNPPAVVNGLVELVNGTTQWKVGLGKCEIVIGEMITIFLNIIEKPCS